MRLNRSHFLAALCAAALSAPAPGLAAQRARAAADLIVAGGTVVTMDGSRRVIADGAVAVRGGRIAAVGPRPEIERRFAARRRIEAAGRVVMPGLINGHTHIPMSLFRGVADDLDLNEWLTKYIFPAEAKNVTERFVRAGTRLGLAEMIRGGTTTYCDMYYFEDAVAEETARAGVRAVLGETVIDFPVPDNKTWAEAIDYTTRFVARWKGHPLITAAIAPHAPYTVSEAHLREVSEFARRTGAPVVIHVAETRKEVEDVAERRFAGRLSFADRLSERPRHRRPRRPRDRRGDRAAQARGRRRRPQPGVEHEARFGRRPRARLFAGGRGARTRHRRGGVEQRSLHVGGDGHGR
jgi:5-methylthioadenosine/S-adenosylhomocysteine deaminase